MVWTGGGAAGRGKLSRRGRYNMRLAPERSMRRMGITIVGLTCKTASHDMTHGIWPPSTTVFLSTRRRALTRGIFDAHTSHSTEKICGESSAR